MAHMKTKAPTRKLLAGTASGATIGPAMATIAVYAWEVIGQIDLPGKVEAAIFSVCVGIAVLAAGYFTPPAADDVPVNDPPVPLIR